MLFQVINNDGVGVMRCENYSCIPSYEDLKDMYNAGYRFKINGKQVPLKKMKEILNEDE